MASERAPLASLILAVGLALGGLLTGLGLSRVRAADRFVTVKGISEREAQADLVIWPLRLSAADNDLARAHAQLESSIVVIRRFLARNQIDTSQMARQDFRVTDAYTNQYAGPERVTSRYVIRETILVRSDKPQLVLAASQRVAELVSAGVVLSSGEEYGGGGPTFVFTGLNRLKPEMIAEATGRARESAEQFARDSRSTLGGIRRANQGVFEILPRDQAPGISEASQIVKTVRVVSTVEYFLR
ncbi:MAG TPA: SIMPL domain-containing protein [Gemmatimonadales bacterium]|nr:SIMPL domain-containing protein [Gemmatimonadales bacterium]